MLIICIPFSPRYRTFHPRAVSSGIKYCGDIPLMLIICLACSSLESAIVGASFTLRWVSVLYFGCGFSLWCMRISSTVACLLCNPGGISQSSSEAWGPLEIWPISTQLSPSSCEDGIFRDWHDCIQTTKTGAPEILALVPRMIMIAEYIPWIVYLAREISVTTLHYHDATVCQNSCYFQTVTVVTDIVHYTSLSICSRWSIYRISTLGHQPLWWLYE